MQIDRIDKRDIAESALEIGRSGGGGIVQIPDNDSPFATKCLVIDVGILFRIEVSVALDPPMLGIPRGIPNQFGGASDNRCPTGIAEVLPDRLDGLRQFRPRKLSGDSLSLNLRDHDVQCHHCCGEQSDKRSDSDD